MKRTDNINIKDILPLPSPGEVKREFPITDKSTQVTAEARETIINILNGKDKRMFAVVGPCSIHDREASLEYAARLKKMKDRMEDKLVILMRTYFEKPRTTIGWKGMMTDPHLDGTYDIVSGIKIVRQILLDITNMGLPCGSEMLEPLMPQYIADMISWASIGARTIESQTHREMASGLSMPVGLKNATSGDLTIALNAMESARHSHSFIGFDQNGTSAIYKTAGNKASHIILRGGKSGPNYDEENVAKIEQMIKNINIHPAIVIDCSHANSGKEFNRQGQVLSSILDQRKRGRESLVGFMIESNLKEGAQKISANLEDLVYGQSVTDACVGWKETEEMLEMAYTSL